MQNFGKWQDGSPTAYQGWRISKLLSYSATNLIRSQKSGKVLETKREPLWRRCFLPQKHHNCVALSLTDLEQPLWLSIGCDKQMFSKIVCVRSLPADKTQPKPVVWNPYCLDDFVAHNSSCFEFVWTSSNTISQWSCHRFVNSFGYLFNAVVDVPIPPLLVSMDHYKQFSRYMNKFQFDVKLIKAGTVEGLCITQHNQAEIIPQGNVFVCHQEVYISALFVCDDEMRDCIGDHIRCVCNSTGRKFKFCKHAKSSTGLPLCGPLYNQTMQGTCEPYLIEEIPSRPLLTEKDDVGQSGSCPNTTEETTIHTVCKEPHEIPCRDGHSKCFNVSQICKYLLNVKNVLEPCKTGEHLEECETFNCTVMFKCLRFYCIPWKYVCDGKWDCPGGSDESPVHFCGERMNCSGLFKCKKIQRCVHFGSLCNGIQDCPSADDESLCSLKHTKCPPGCECLTFAILCSNVTLKTSQMKDFLSFTVIFLKKSEVGSFDLSKCRNCYLFQCNLMPNLCELLNVKNNLQILQIPSNNISDLHSECFSRSGNIKMIDVSKNEIHAIPTGTFSELAELRFINFSFNPLQEIGINAFYNLTQLTILCFAGVGNFFERTDMFASIEFKVFDTDIFWLCCLVPQQTTCSSVIPWFFSCTDLLINNSFSWLFGGLCAFITAANSLSLVMQRMSFKMQRSEKTGAFGALVSLVNVSDIFCAIPLFLLWIYNFVYRGKFIFLAYEWQCSEDCLIIFGFFLFFSFLSPLVLNIFSLSRLQIVNHPLDTKFKETVFVLKCAFPAFCISALISIVLTLLTTFLEEKTLNTEMPMVICVPFADVSHKMILIKVTTFASVTLQVLSAVFITIVYTQLFLSLKASQAKLASSVSKQHSNKSLIVQIIIVTSSNILCWVPSSVIYLSSMFLPQHPLGLIYWTVAVVYPLNSVVNPVVFIVTTTRKMLR